jgi:hypothetical protein
MLMFRLSLLAALGLLLSAIALTAQSPNSAPAPAATESPKQETMEDPQVGDHWTYEVRDDVTGEVKLRGTSTITDVTATVISVRHAFAGNSKFCDVSYDRSWNAISDNTFRSTPNNDTGMMSSLAVGKNWSVIADGLNGTTWFGWKRSVTSKVVAQESVTTRAGTFDTFKIDVSVDFQNTSDPNWKFQDVVGQVWYAPAIDHWVKERSVRRSDGHVGNDTVELVDYGRKQ